VREFDPTLTSVLNFGDPEAFKAIVTPLGLEELRVVVRYEVLNLQLLITGVRHNQILLDNCQRMLAEIDLFEKGWLVSAPTCNILPQLHGQNLYELNLKKMPTDERRKVFNKIDTRASKLCYSVIAKKIRPKETVEQAFKKIRQEVINKQYEKVEIGLRFMRTSRLLLCYDYCTDI
jgi:hypothetical protein